MGWLGEDAHLDKGCADEERVDWACEDEEHPHARRDPLARDPRPNREAESVP